MKQDIVTKTRVAPTTAAIQGRKLSRIESDTKRRKSCSSNPKTCLHLKAKSVIIPISVAIPTPGIGAAPPIAASPCIRSKRTP